MKPRMLEVGLWTLAVLCPVAIIAWAALAPLDDRADVSIDTVPARASAWLDGNYVGTTPVELAGLRTGEHVLEVRKSGYAPLVERLTLAEGPNTLCFDLEKRPGGSLEVKSSPEGAEVFVDGTSRGQTPLVLSDIETSTVSVRLRHVNYVDWTATVEIESGRTARISAALQDRMEAHYLAAIREHPNDPTGWCDLAHYDILQDRWTQAEDAFTQTLVVSKRPDAVDYSSRIYQEIYKVFFRQFNYSDLKRGREVVVRALLRSAKACPKAGEFYGATVWLALEADMPTEAREVIELGVVNFPDSLSWVNELHGAFQNYRTGNVLDAGSDARLRKDPNDFVGRFVRMAMRTLRGQFTQAIEDYEAVIPQVKNDHVKALLLVQEARLHTRTKQPEKALETWQRAVTIEKDVEQACRWRLELADACVAAGKKPLARATLDEVLRLSSDAALRASAESRIKGL